MEQIRELLRQFLYYSNASIIRIIKSLPFTAHTSSYFDELILLNIFQLGKYKAILCMFKKGFLPVIFFSDKYDFHLYHTRSRNHLRSLRCRKTAGQTSMNHNGAIIWNSIAYLIDQ